MAILPINPLPSATSTGSNQQQPAAQTSSPFMATAAAVPQTAAVPEPATGPFRRQGSTPLTPPSVHDAGLSPPQHTMPTTSPVGSVVDQRYPALLDEANIMGHYINQLTASDNPLMRNARILGIEHAAARGLQNSSIAAGNAQRAVLDTVVPLAQAAMDTFNQRENRGWTSEENRLDRQQQLTMAEVQNWLNNESFVREFNAQLALAPIANTFQLLQMIMKQAVEQPDVYTPDVVSGFSEFFNTNMLDILARYFPTLYSANTGGSR